MAGRGLGIAVAVERLLPPAVRELFGLLTYLGDAGVLLGAVALYHWSADSGRERERGAFALATALGATALSFALKGLFALPRPPADLHLGDASGYGFPSGHAIAAPATWGVLALALAVDRARGRPPARVRTSEVVPGFATGIVPGVIAALVVAVVAISRVAIGVHYAVDVVVGIGVGLVYLGALLRLADWRAGRGFAVAIGLALVAVATNGLTPDAVAALAGSLGAGAAWLWIRTASDSSVGPPASVGPPVAVAGLVALGVVGYAGNALGVGLSATFALNLAVPAGILALPLAVERVRTREASNARR
ncbi:phosphatase PAP2 family protein [Halorussus litoreus]|uniref:phosphatase PAP2 family protein n=1 Tax=Halorussus litoreus TaxID=1710536 RepID=UPI000E21D691|nr:phosphatase PAP2 family protein [Halorussus litoreus]